MKRYKKDKKTNEMSKMLCISFAALIFKTTENIMNSILMNVNENHFLPLFVYFYHSTTHSVNKTLLFHNSSTILSSFAIAAIFACLQSTKYFPVTPSNSSATQRCSVV